MREEMKQLIAAKPCSRKEALIEEIMIALSFHVSQWPEIRLRSQAVEAGVRGSAAVLLAVVLAAAAHQIGPR